VVGAGVVGAAVVGVSVFGAAVVGVAVVGAAVVGAGVAGVHHPSDKTRRRIQQIGGGCSHVFQKLRGEFQGGVTELSLQQNSPACCTWFPEIKTMLHIRASKSEAIDQGAREELGYGLVGIAIS